MNAQPTPHASRRSDRRVPAGLFADAVAAWATPDQGQHETTPKWQSSPPPPPRLKEASMPGITSQPRPENSVARGTSDLRTDHGRRLSPVDGSFLRLESPQSHMHVGFSAVFAAPSGRPRPSVESLRDRAAGRLHEVPWCRWRLDPAPLGLSEPRWIDDAQFDLAAHIVALTQPDDRVSHASFEALRSTVLSAPLDRSRPLWQIFLVPRLEDGRVGMVGKIHHALVDGLAALQIVNLILDPEPDVASEPPVPWQPRGRPGRVGWALDAVTRTFADGVGALRAGATAATHPPAAVANAVRDARRVLDAAAEEVLSPAPPSALNVPIGARRTLVGYHAGRDELRAARRVGGTLNDVGLAAVAGAVRALLQRDGERPPPEPLKAMVPVSMRRLGDTTAGNQISMITIALPVHLDSASRAAGLGARADQAPQANRPAGRHAEALPGGGSAADAAAIDGGQGDGNTATVQPHRLTVARAERVAVPPGLRARRGLLRRPHRPGPRARDRDGPLPPGALLRLLRRPGRAAGRPSSCPALIEAELQELGRAAAGARSGIALASPSGPGRRAGLVGDARACLFPRSRRTSIGEVTRLPRMVVRRVLCHCR